MKWKSFFEERKKRLKRKAWWAFWRKRPYIFLNFSYSLSWNKESKFKTVSNHAKNIRFSSWRFELAALKHQIVFALACAFDAPLFFTHDLIRPGKNDIQILKILNHFRITCIKKTLTDVWAFLLTDFKTKLIVSLTYQPSLLEID